MSPKKELTDENENIFKTLMVRVCAEDIRFKIRRVHRLLAHRVDLQYSM